MTAKTQTPRRILAVHQGYELYGSDRTFISSLQAFRQSFPTAQIKVILPRDGLLLQELQRLGFEVELSRLWIARKANGLLGNLLLALAFPAYLFRAWRMMNAASVTYINTSVVFDYAIAARLTRRPSLLHIHEIPTGFAHKVIRTIARLSGATLIFNSEATKLAFEPLGGQPNALILNGVPDTARSSSRDSRDGDRVRILMIGRINDWKGQDLLVEALARLPAEIAERTELRLLGSAFESGPAERQLKSQIEALGLPCSIRMEGFVEDPSEAFEWSDFIVVPSRKPEPFGLVAVEAMMHRRAVIGASHGGLMEIIVDGETGLVFTPNDAEALASAIRRAATDRPSTAEMGAKGRARFEARFSLERYQRQLAKVVETVLAKDRPMDKAPAMASGGVESRS